jgi:hypothetical protein
MQENMTHTQHNLLLDTYWLGEGYSWRKDVEAPTRGAPCSHEARQEEPTHGASCPVRPGIGADRWGTLLSRGPAGAAQRLESTGLKPSLLCVNA